MKKISRIFIWSLGLLALGCVVLIFICNQIIVNNAKGKVFSDMDSIHSTTVGLLLGTTPQTRIGRKPNQFFKFRIDAAENLYKVGKIKKILISGDENSLDGVNEVECMRDSLVGRGVLAADIILDGKGFRTLDSVVRAVHVYDVHSFVVISQKFHNERAVYLAENLGLRVHHITAFNAADATANLAFMTYVREYFARVKVFIDLLCKK